MKSLRITIAGASGFIGKNLIKSLDSNFQIKALSRSNVVSTGNELWVQADLFSFQSTKSALEDTDIAIYLVHSMLPSSRLFQGTFQDTDLFIADNFASACLENNVKQIIYLGGLVPEKEVSAHLQSRKEVEGVLRSSRIPTTILRTGMVVGDGGSSFEILKNLVMKLPVMILPRWTESFTQAIFIEDLIRVLIKSLNQESFFNKTINVVNGEKITYKKLIEQSSTSFGGSKILIPAPINYTSFSKLWVTIFGNSNYELVSPLIDSLLCNLPSPEIPSEIEDCIQYKSFKQMLVRINPKKLVKNKKSKTKWDNTVRSIQRLANPQKLDIDILSDEYVRWLPKYMKNFIQVKSKKGELLFVLRGLKKPLLVLQRQSFNDELDRVKFHIVGGFLSKTKDTGWLEFRKVSGGEYTLASINNFIPALPWYIYIYSQAVVHLYVMHAFSKHLNSMPEITCLEGLD